MTGPMILLKAFIKGHTKKNGTYVRPYHTKTPTAKPKPATGQASLFSKPELPASAVAHPVEGHQSKDMPCF